jgi:phosphoribosyl 1,2-cyclic phosphate phosphodiesterase
MRVTILGCGASAGVPLIGCNCPVCKSPNPKNKRLRSSILIEEGNDIILIDSSPDLRQQAISNNITQIDAVLFTHAHADHVGGIDELRSFNYLTNKPLPVYTNKATLAELERRFDYAFIPEIPHAWYRPCLVPTQIKDYDEFEIGGLAIESFPQTHGKLISLGFKTGDFAYSTDTNDLSKDILTGLKGIKLWIVDCLRPVKAPTHSHLEQTLSWIEFVKPERAILTHMSHDFDYEELKNQLPPGVEPAYDTMVVEV